MGNSLTADARPLANIRVVLVEPQHPGNVGACARAMMNMGLAELVLVAPHGALDDPQARAQAVHAAPLLAQARTAVSLDAAVAGCGWVLATSARPRHLGDEPLTPWAAADKAIALAADCRVALVFGRERVGLTNEELDRCHAVTMIPTSAEYSSLNLAAAVLVLGYELRKAAEQPRRVARKKSHPNYLPPSAEEVEQFYTHLEQVLLQTGFLDPRNPRLLMRRLRTLFNRTQPDRNELNILRGILSTVEEPKRRSRAK